MACNENQVKYLIVRPHEGGIMDLLKYMLWGDIQCGMMFLEASQQQVAAATAIDHRWVIFVSIIVRKIISLFRKPMEYTGILIDFFFNFLSLNGGFFGLIYNLVHGKVPIAPKRGTQNFISTIGHIDGRIELYTSNDFTQVLFGTRALMDLCMMGSKLAYENAQVVRNVVSCHWKMHFVDFYDCWNDFQKEKSTQVFILCDKPIDASLILVSFRGTEPFDTDDWSTDFDYSWYEIPKLGKVHMGFLEALGLGSRTNVASFHTSIQIKEHSNSQTPSYLDLAAYYLVKSKLKTLLTDHPNAKFVITGHSLGGALAILFPTVLVLHNEIKLMERLLGVYTFGQPRIGDEHIGAFMQAHLEQPVQKYFRVVYCNDLVPRLPYDNKTFLYKHFGTCLYYNSLYMEQETWLSTMVRLIGLALPGITDHCPTDYVNSVRIGKERTLQNSTF
ncbi:hypothetical protein ACFE04_021713 [Oxalis oulophora]